jgi:hypothetical protein
MLILILLFYVLPVHLIYFRFKLVHMTPFWKVALAEPAPCILHTTLGSAFALRSEGPVGGRPARRARNGCSGRWRPRWWSARWLQLSFAL